MYRPLAPGPWFKSVEEEEFIRLYMAQLKALYATKVVEDLLKLADGLIPALLCFEKSPPDPHWCHRGLVSAWLADELTLEVSEFDHQLAGFGWKHPKLSAFHTR